jgi:glutaredoxin 3
MSAVSTVRDRVQKFISDNTVAIFSKVTCPYCSAAKSAMANYSLKGYKVWEIDSEKDMSEIQDVLKDITGGRSVPRVFIAQQFIGGGDDTVAAHKSGKLKELLEKAGALEK